MWRNFVQPIKFKTENIGQQFKSDNIDLFKDCINFISKDNVDEFKEFLKNTLSAPPLFITKVKIFKNFCEEISILEKSYSFKDKGYARDIRRLPAYIERDMPLFGLKKL